MSRADVLVDADWAEQNLDTDGIVFVEVGEDLTAYERGHLRGAVKLDWTSELQDPIVRDFVDKEAFGALMSRKGIRNDDTIVLCGGNSNWVAAYAYRYWKVYGHASVKLLDGGRKKWELDGRTLTTDLVERPATAYVAHDQNLSIRAFRDEVIAGIGNKNLLDIRSPDEFAGRLLAPANLPQEQSQRPGHIPGASNVPWARTTNEDGSFKSDEEIDTIYREAGLDWSKDIIAYCRIGERSSHSWFAIHELLDHKNIKNYDGSWTEYGSLVGVPIEVGP